MRSALALCGIALGVCGSACAASIPLTPQLPHVPEPVAWTSYAGENQLQNSAWSRSLTRASVPRLAPVWTKRLDGRIFASPLAFTVGGRRLLFVSTEAGSVYALNAGDGSIVWQRNVGTVETGACGTWGITATGAISRYGRVLYVIGATGLLHALSLESGDDAAGCPRQLIAHPDYEYVWDGLRIAAGRLYVPVASYCDVGAPNGFFPEGGLFVIPLEQPDSVSEWDAVPGEQNLGGTLGLGRRFSQSGHRSRLHRGRQLPRLVRGMRLLRRRCRLTAITWLRSLRTSRLSSMRKARGSSPRATTTSARRRCSSSQTAVRHWRLRTTRTARSTSGTAPGSRAGRSPSSRGRRCVGVRRNPRLVRGSADPLLRPGRSLRREGPARERRTRLPRPEGLPVRAGVGEPARGREPGDAARRGQRRPFCHRRHSGGFYGLSTKTGGILWKFPTAGRTVAVMITVGGALFGADTEGTVYAFRPRAVSPH